MLYSGRIGTYSFRVLTELISESYDLSTTTLKHINGMSTNLYNTDINDKKLAVGNFKTAILKTYSAIVVDHITSNIVVLNSVRSLNNHVLSTYGQIYGYDSIDEFLEKQFLNVPVSYAMLSSLVGFNITKIGEKKALYKDIDTQWQNIEYEYGLLGWENL